MKKLSVGILLALFISLVQIGSAIDVSGGNISSYSMNSAGSTYDLKGDVTANTTAFVANANGVILDGHGYNVTFAVTGTGYGVLSDGKDNITVKNVNLIQQNVSASSSMGIYTINHADNITVQFCAFDISSTSGNGVCFIRTNDSRILNVAGRSSGSSGIYITISNNTSCAECNSASSAAHGIGVSVSDNIQISNCTGRSTVSATTGSGIYLATSTAVNVTNSKGISDAGTGFYAYNGVNNGTFINCTGESNSYYGLYIYSSNNSTFTDCKGTSASFFGIRIAKSIGNAFSNAFVQSPLASTPINKNHILCMGDSITEGGAGGTVFGGWGNYMRPELNNSLEWYVSDAGIGGETAYEGRLRIKQELAVFKPTVVTIMYGTNDIAAGRTQQDIIDDILWMAETSQSQNAIPYILLTTPQASGNSDRVYLDQNLSQQARALGYRVINVYDSVDSQPQNGLYDAYVAGRHADGVHPNAVGNELIGKYIARNILAMSSVYIGSNINHTIYANGLMINSRDVFETDTLIPFRAIPNENTITVNISTWETTGNCSKVWNESSTTATSTRHLIGDFPANAPIQILRDDTNYAVVTSNATGYIDWTYSGGYSEHTFEATVGSPVTLTVASLNALNSSSEAATNVTLSAETQYTGMGALYNSVRDTISSGYTLASLIILVIGAYALFRYMGYI